jgi:molecular chaperone GrpE
MSSPADQSAAVSSGDDVSGISAEPDASQAEPDAELARLEDRWRRAVADLDNLRKRYARELARERAIERSRVAAVWLPVVDNLERAISHADERSGALGEGVRTILSQATQVLEQLGYPPDSETGIPFDPQRHEVVGITDATDVPPGTVVEVTRPGYGVGAQQLRPAAVMVSRRED